MFSKSLTYIFLFACLVFIPNSAAAQIAEVRVGLTEFDERSLNVGIATQRANENSIAINGEILFEEPKFLKWALSPQPYIGGTLNLEGKTSYGGAGLLWRQGFGEKFYGDFAVGFVAHTGTNDISDFFERISPDRENIQFGSTILFREQVALGYNVNEDWSAELFFEHLSNAGLAFNNEGADSLGFRAVKKF